MNEMDKTDIMIEDDFDLDIIAESGQCFRWQKQPDGSYTIISRDKVLDIRCTDRKNVYSCTCDHREFDEFWYHYFDLHTCYREIRHRIPRSDVFLFDAARETRGIRILGQDPWEMLITFIISQRKSIPAIKKAVEAICLKAGRKIAVRKGEVVYSFPDPGALSCLSMQELNECGLGYRSPYVYETARAIAGGRLDLDKIAAADDEILLQELLRMPGVGKKVANCVLLFAYHRLDSFPRDVWIERILEEYYPDGFDFERYRPYNGIMQQYMFAYFRNRARRS